MSKSISKPVFLNPPGLYDPTAHCYSQVAIVESPTRFIYVAGQGGETPQGAPAPDFEAQVRQALHNVQTALASAEADFSDVVKISVFIVDHSQQRLEIFGKTYYEFLAGRQAPPCTLIPVPRLALDSMQFEIEATAAVRL